MQPSVRFRLDDVTELPEKITNYYEAALTPNQLLAYNAVRQKAVALIGEKRIDALNAGAVLSKLLQIALGYAYTRSGEIVTFDNAPRLQLILDLIDSAIKKVILFAPFKSAIAAFSDMMKKQKIDHCIVTGDVLISKRNVIFREFQDTPKYKVILAHPACMAHALTLTAASTTIWGGPITSLDTFHQANARTYRVGQDTKTLIGMIGGTPAEKKIYTLLGNNEKLQNQFLNILELQTEEATSNS
jgi:SNF2 family DNA or RNA helicase